MSEGIAVVYLPQQLSDSWLRWLIWMTPVSPQIWSFPAIVSTH